MKPDENGMALMIAVWAVILIGGLVTGMVVMGGGDAAITANRIETARAGALAEAGVLRAVAALTDPAAREKLELDQPFTVQLEDAASITVVVRDSCGAIDLNWAPGALLRAYGVAEGMSHAAAARFASAIEARREAGLEETADGLPSHPWQSLDQLNALPDMDRATLNRIIPGLTVNCREAGADPRLAPDLVREALQLSGAAGSPSHGLAYEIEAQARLASGARVTLRAAIWLSRQPGPPAYYITGWRSL